MVTEGDSHFFDPVGLYVEPGETITWTNDSRAHSTTAYAEGNPSASVRRIPEEAEAWNSGTLTEQGATFEIEGTYDYYCIPHKTLGMVGRLVVGKPGGPAVDSHPPDGSLPSGDAIAERGAIGWDAFGE